MIVRERLVLLLDAHALLRLDRLVQALRPAPPFEDPPGVLVDDLDLAVDHGVVDVALVQRLRLQRLVQVVDEVAVLGAVEVVDPEEALGLGDALLGHRHGLVLLVDLVVEVGDELLLAPAAASPSGVLPSIICGASLANVHVEVGRLLGRPGDDQRRARLVDQDVVDLVDDREVWYGEPLSGFSPAAVLDLLLERGGHVVAQVVEAELGVGAVRDVGGVGERFSS